jgi:hypothetical protein
MLLQVEEILTNLQQYSDETRQHLHDHFDEEFDQRFVGSKTAIDRVPLDCLGPWHQLHWDGHEKLGAQALDMGGVALPIYAGKDQFSSFVPVMRVIPNSRLGETIGHFFIDFAEEYGCKFDVISSMLLEVSCRDRYTPPNDNR